MTQGINLSHLAEAQEEKIHPKTKDIFYKIAQDLGEIKENFFNLSLNFESLENSFQATQDMWEA